MKVTLGALVLFALWLGAADGAVAQNAREDRSVHTIGFQMSEDDPKLWTLMLNNIDNLVAALGKNHVDIKVVAYGPGINMFRKERSGVLARLGSLKKFAGTNVEYTVCSNTLKAMNVDRQEIAELVDDFYPGIVRIALLQEKGYVYLRP